MYEGAEQRRFLFNFEQGRRTRMLKVGSLPHGCVHSRETSAYPPAKAASQHYTLERRCARLKILPSTHQEQFFLGHLLDWKIQILLMRFSDHFKLRRPIQVDLNPSFIWLWDNRVGSAADTLILLPADRGAQTICGWFSVLTSYIIISSGRHHTVGHNLSAFQLHDKLN